jgi:hypothetical protein
MAFKNKTRFRAKEGTEIRGHKAKVQAIESSKVLTVYQIMLLLVFAFIFFVLKSIGLSFILHRSKIDF